MLEGCLLTRSAEMRARAEAGALVVHQKQPSARADRERRKEGVRPLRAAGAAAARRVAAPRVARALAHVPCVRRAPRVRAGALPRTLACWCTLGQSSQELLPLPSEGPPRPCGVHGLDFLGAPKTHAHALHRCRRPSGEQESSHVAAAPAL